MATRIFKGNAFNTRGSRIAIGSLAAGLVGGLALGIGVPKAVDHHFAKPACYVSGIFDGVNDEINEDGAVSLNGSISGGGESIASLPNGSTADVTVEESFKDPSDYKSIGTISIEVNAGGHDTIDPFQDEGTRQVRDFNLPGMSAIVLKVSVDAHKHTYATSCVPNPQLNDSIGSN